MSNKLPKATKQDLSELHALLARNMLARLQEQTPVMRMTLEGPVPTGDVRYTANNADWNAIAKFLKDNEVTADKELSASLGALGTALKQQTRRSDNVVPLLPLPSLAAVNGN